MTRDNSKLKQLILHTSRWIKNNLSTHPTITYDVQFNSIFFFKLGEIYFIVTIVSGIVTIVSGAHLDPVIEFYVCRSM